MSAKVKAILAALKGPEETPRKGRTGYAHTYAFYVQKYGKDLSTIKRWAREGKPLDDEKLMAEMMSPRGRKPEFAQAAGADPQPDPESIGSPVKLDERFFAGAGVLSAIERLQTAERERAGAYFRAITTTQPTAIVQNRFKEWMGVIEALRKMEEAAPGIRKLNDLTVDRSEMEAAIGTVFAAFKSAARTMPGRAAAKLIGLRDRDEIFGILEREIEVLLRTLTDIAVGEARNAAELERAAAPEAQEPPPAPEPPDPIAPPAEIKPEPAKRAPKKAKRKGRRQK
jgi:hypothetical protein